MSDVKLNDLSLVKSARTAVSSPSPESRQSAVTLVRMNDAAQSASREAKLQPIAENATRERSGVLQKDQQIELREAVTQLSDYVQSVQRDLSFEMDESSGKTIITVIDRKTQEIIRQLPDEVVLKLARNLQQDEPLSLFNVKV